MKDRQVFIFAAFLAFALVGCKYQSYAEASAACWKWRNKGGGFTITIPAGFFNPKETFRRPIRDCEDEDASRVVLGYSYLIKDGGYHDAEANGMLGRKIVKHFKW